MCEGERERGSEGEIGEDLPEFEGVRCAEILAESGDGERERWSEWERE